MLLADAVLTGYLPDLYSLSYMMPYQGGQSVLCYLADRYGPEKIGELLNRLQTMRRMDSALEETFGIDSEQLSKEWQLQLRRYYWPMIAEKQLVSELATPVTDHQKRGNYINNSPAISPGGERVAYLTNRNGYFDIYMYHIARPDKIERIISGQRDSRFEELHWLRPGISWSPDGKNIAFCSKSGEYDMIHLVDVAKRKVVRDRVFQGLGAFSPSWSPDGNEIAFVGLLPGRTDIFGWDLQTDEIRKITDDVHSDFEPAWSPDGTRLAFISDRGTATDSGNSTDPPTRNNYSRRDLFLLDCESSSLLQLTATDWDEATPEWYDDDKILYVADRNGIGNLYSIEPSTGTELQLTNLLTGLIQPSVSRSSGRLAFSGYERGGYDVYLLEDLKVFPEEGVLMAERENLPFQYPHLQTVDPETLSYGGPAAGGYEHYDFSDLAFRDRSAVEDLALSDTLVFLDGDRRYLQHDYKLKFSLDAVQAQAVYSQYFGLQGSSLLMMSDLLGNHRYYLSLDLYNQIQFTNFQLYYEFLKTRPTFHAGIFRNLYTFYAGADTAYQDNFYGVNLQLAWPFSRFTRLELRNRLFKVSRGSWDLNHGELDRNGYPKYEPYNKRSFLLPSLRLVKDNILWGSTGPANGFRGYLGFTMGRQFKLGGETWGVNFQSLTCDLRRYLLINRDYQFAFRFGGGHSWGEQPQKFFLGGTQNWINYHYAPVNDDDADLLTGMESIYLSEFVFPLRGSRYYERIGDSYFVTNMEFRFPLLRYLQLGWPLQIGIGNLRGVLFYDIGHAWDWNSNDILRDTNDLLIKDNLLLGYGWGARINLGYFMLKMDAAWRYDLDRGSSMPTYTFSLGTDF
jgi:Tol biopolymer transport system component